jgi:hypothetical protein
MPEDHGDGLARWVRGRSTGGVAGRGTYEEDDPGTWEILTAPKRDWRSPPRR